MTGNLVGDRETASHVEGPFTARYGHRKINIKFIRAAAALRPRPAFL